MGDKASKFEKLIQKRNSKKVVSLLKSRQADIRNQAIAALGKIADDNSVNTLIGMLTDPNPEIRKVVINSMGEMSNQTVKTHLQHLIQVEKDESVIQAAKDALSKIPKVV